MGQTGRRELQRRLQLDAAPKASLSTLGTLGSTHLQCIQDQTSAYLFSSPIRIIDRKAPGRRIKTKLIYISFRPDPGDLSPAFNSKEQAEDKPVEQVSLRLIRSRSETLQLSCEPTDRVANTEEVGKVLTQRAQIEGGFRMHASSPGWRR